MGLCNWPTGLPSVCVAAYIPGGHVGEVTGEV